MIAALNRFISRSADRCRPFYLLINKWKGFEWFEDCTTAFQQLKEYLLRPPIMSSPAADEVLYTYIAVAPHAVSLVLIREDNGLQRPVYYISKSLHEAEIRYSPLEKAILVVVHASRKKESSYSFKESPLYSITLCFQKKKKKKSLGLLLGLVFKPLLGRLSR